MRTSSFEIYLAVAGLAASLSACDRRAGDEERAGDQPAPVAADNTKKNERDRDNALTPADQSETEGDRAITQSIRQAVVKKDGLSMNARNVKIITIGGVVTLRGPVENATEKADIAAIAQQTSGVARVDNQLEIAAN